MREANPLSLYELNNLVKGVLDNTLNSHYWIVAETSDVRANQNGHCYLEFIQKDKSGRNTIAKARAMIWANSYFLLKSFFEESTKQPFSSGLKVLVEVSVTFHELYGYSLVVHDIDPSYTLGDQARNRAEIIKQLTEDGVLNLNKELDFPILPNKIAIISSPTAAGYEDFCNQLENNPYGLKFYTKLFPAIMQGDRTEDSIIKALEKIYAHQDCFNLVIIIRGGGATSELNCFDSYLLAASCAQFPLPIVTGIGHERDETVLDLVAHTRAKTPTAVAELLINLMSINLNDLSIAHQNIEAVVQSRMQAEYMLLQSLEVKNTLFLKNWSKHQTQFLDWSAKSLRRSLTQYGKAEEDKLVRYSANLKSYSDRKMKEQSNQLDVLQKHLDFLSPLNLLKKGYTYTLKEGRLVTKKESLKQGDKITTMFQDGKITSTID